MRRSRIAGVAALALLLVGTVSSVRATSSVTQHRRIFLLGGEGGAAYWGVDPADPELSRVAITRHCGELSRVDPATSSCQGFAFMPASTLVGRPAGGGPIRFHLELSLVPAVPIDVTVRVQEDTSLSEGLATEVAPGVWEGTIEDPTPFSGRVNLVTVGIRAAVPEFDASIGAAGRSWLELPKPFTARSVPDLIQADQHRPEPTTYTGGTRTLRFNDRRWLSASFEGALDRTRTFAFDLPEQARTLIAWVDVFDSPIVYDALRGRQPDPAELENAPRVSLTRDGEEIARGTNGGYRFRGQDALAVFDVAPGPLTLTVTDETWDPDGGGARLPYKLHVVAMHGERTLAGMHWTTSAMGDFNAPLVASCGYGQEVIPVSDDVTTFKVALDWDSEAPGLPAWTIRYDLPTVGDMVCGDVGNRLRFTVDVPERVWLIGPAPAADATYVSNGDTVFDWDVTYTYAPGD